ncbi:hypothetical protein M2134_002089 [Parabacteroides sp. PM6-13]|uniref:DUF6242 domain-containing protein n=1 Tax=Parabacteroides sp. PM6-13 TaxID=1742408 RepID=UPI0024751F70|nr:DUF6242 domain-containing protein [Parabacteroides sp. PM6-13]MDH6343209.1 hypothetical protein [Parabacteroides sp. PM6-13]
MKKNLVLLITGGFVWLMSSCLGDSSSTIEAEAAKDCQITEFTLNSGDVEELSNVKFTIDQINGLIFNLDSLPYGSDLKMAVCNLTYASTVLSLEYTPEAVGDTVMTYSETDSIDFSKPVKFIVTAYDGLTKKNYTARVNTHQIIPDTLEWEFYAKEESFPIKMKEQQVVPFAYNGQEGYLLYGQPAGAGLPYRLYFSALDDMINWEPIALEGLPTDEIMLYQMVCFDQALYVPSVNGKLYKSVDGQRWSVVGDTPYVAYIISDVKEGGRSKAALAVVIEEAGELKFAAMDGEGLWTVGETIPEDFPLIGFGKEYYSSHYNSYLMIVGGRTLSNQLTNQSWGTMDGVLWARLSDINASYFAAREGVMVTAYDDKIYLIGGIDAAGNAYRDIYESIDKGVTWQKVTALIILPDTYRARGYGSVIVDKNQYINIFGGKTSANGNVLREIWRGRINRLGF